MLDDFRMASFAPGHSFSTRSFETSRPLHWSSLCEWVIGEPREDVGKPGARIDVVERAGFDQRVDRGGAPPARVGAAEGPVAAADGDATRAALGGVIRHADAAVVEEAREGVPSLGRTAVQPR